MIVVLLKISHKINTIQGTFRKFLDRPLLGTTVATFKGLDKFGVSLDYDWFTSDLFI